MNKSLHMHPLLRAIVVQIVDNVNYRSLIMLAFSWVKSQDYSRIQDFEADFAQKADLVDHNSFYTLFIFQFILRQSTI